MIRTGPLLILLELVDQIDPLLQAVLLLLVVLDFLDDLLERVASACFCATVSWRSASVRFCMYHQPPAIRTPRIRPADDQDVVGVCRRPPRPRACL